MKKALIIGSGIGGIATGLRLRSKGFEVEIFESNTTPGGKLGSLQLGGYRFDRGPSLFTMPQYVDELFHLFGENPRDYFNYNKLKYNCFYFFEDGTFIKSPSNKDEFIKTLCKELGETEKSLSKFMQKSETIYKITNPIFLKNLYIK